MGHLRVSAPFLLAASLLSSLARAAPAPRPLEARDYVTHIVTETVWTTIDITTTIYVDELSLTSAPASTTAEMTVSALEDSSSAVATSSSAPMPTSDAPAPAPEPVSTEPASSEEAPAPSTAAAEFAESSAPPAPVYPPPESSVPAYSAPDPAPAPPASSEPPAPSPVNQAPDNYGSSDGSSGGSSGGSESATCEGSSSSCKGDITWYEGGLGACGTNVDTGSDMAIALPYEFMGTASNSNPYCGKTVTVKNPASGSTVQGTVKDKCMGCVGRSIDLTNTMFNAVTDGKGDGRVKNVEWWFN